MRTKQVKIADLKLADYNPRQITDHDMASLVNSIREFGIVEPVVVNKNNTVIGGHQRLVACKQLSIESIPVVYVDLPKKKEKILNLALNRIHGDWDLGKLSVVLEELKLGNGDEIGLTGFELGEIDEIIDSQIPEDDGEDNFDGQGEAARIKNPISKRGQVYQLGRHRLMCGDATVKADVEKLMDGKKADMVFTDPPYGIETVQSNQVGGGGSTKFGKVGGGNIVPSSTYRVIEGDNNTDAARGFYHLCISRGVVKLVFFGGNYFTDFLPPSSCWIIWDKENTGNFADAEMAWTSFNGSARLYRWTWNGLVRKGKRVDELVSRVHPTQKPVGLFTQILNDFATEIILDGFGGSGTTLIAAEKTGRVCYMMEIDPVYCDVIRKRYEEFIQTTGRK